MAKLVSFCLFDCGKEISNVVFSENVSSATVGLIEGLLFPGKVLFVTGMCLIWRLMEYTNDKRPDASIIRKFQYKFLLLIFQQILPEKTAVKLFRMKFFARKTYVQNKHK